MSRYSLSDVRELGRGLFVRSYVLSDYSFVIWAFRCGLSRVDVIPPTTKERFRLSSMGSLIS